MKYMNLITLVISITCFGASYWLNQKSKKTLQRATELHIEMKELSKQPIVDTLYIRPYKRSPLNRF